MAKAPILAIALLALPALAADRQAYRIADFEGPSALENWKASSGPEASATGAIALGPGHRDRGAVLSYRLPCEGIAGCRAYAAASWKPPSPLPKRTNPAISLWIRMPAEVAVSLVVKDTGGQTLRFAVEATIEYPRPGGWQYAYVLLSGPGQAIQGRVTGIGIMAQARYGANLQGSVSFDEMELREMAAPFRVGPGEATSPPEFDISPSRLGVNVHLLQDNRSLDLAHSAGFGFVRTDLLWANVERGGRYRFAAYDEVLRAAEARGMAVLWILDYGHPDHGGSPPRTPQDIAAFGRFAEAAAEHFKGHNVRYEIWNEPDTRQFWQPAPNADEYAALLREAVAAIRRADASARISSGGLSRFDEAYLARAVDAPLAAGLNAIGVHPYPKGGPESIAPDLATLRDVVGRAFGTRIEIWDTEWGYSSTNVGRQGQAGLAVREILTVWSVGLPQAVWYDLRDDGADAANAEYNYGLLDSSGAEKPAMVAVRNLLAAAGARKYAGMVAETPAGTHAMRFDGTADILLIVWSDRPGGRLTVEYPRRNLISATDILGRPVKSKNDSGAEIEEGAGPIYLLWRAR